MKKGSGKHPAAGFFAALLVVAVVLTLFLPPSAAAGEETPKQETTQEKKVRARQAFDTLTVTAQKIEEEIQDIPISISVFDQIALEDRNIDQVQDIAAYVPNFLLMAYGTTSSTSPSIRGMNTEGGSFSSAVGMFVDGVPFLGPTGFNMPLMDIVRVEVLKGPQGTLYGKGVEAGVIV